MSAGKQFNVYCGTRADGTPRVAVNGKKLSPQQSQKIRNHSPDGFNWGYGGSGPAQLALAILCHEFGRQTAEALYQRFKFKFVAGWGQTWQIDSIDLEAFLKGNPVEKREAEEEIRLF